MSTELQRALHNLKSELSILKTFIAEINNLSQGRDLVGLHSFLAKYLPPVTASIQKIKDEPLFHFLQSDILQVESFSLDLSTFHHYNDLLTVASFLAVKLPAIEGTLRNIETQVASHSSQHN